MIGDAIRQLRKQRRWLQTDLAEKSGIPQGTISNLELNKYPNPTQETLVKLAQAFSITVDDLLRAAGLEGLPLETLRAEGLPEKDLERLVKLWPRLSARNRARLLDLAHELADLEGAVSALESPAQPHPPRGPARQEPPSEPPRPDGDQGRISARGRLRRVQA